MFMVTLQVVPDTVALAIVSDIIIGIHSTYIRSIHQTRSIATMAPAM
jgi:hypothetical protein